MILWCAEHPAQLLHLYFPLRRIPDMLCKAKVQQYCGRRGALSSWPPQHQVVGPDVSMWHTSVVHST